MVLTMCQEGHVTVCIYVVTYYTYHNGEEGISKINEGKGHM